MQTKMDIYIREWSYNGRNNKLAATKISQENNEKKNTTNKQIINQPKTILHKQTLIYEWYVFLQFFYWLSCLV